MKYFISLFFILLPILYADTITKKFIDIDNILITNSLDPLLQSYQFNNYPDDYGEVFVDLNNNGKYDKKAIVSIYSKEKDLSDRILDGKEQGLLANIVVEIDEFCPRKSLEKYLETANSGNIMFNNGITISTSVSNHFVDSQLLTWDPKENKSYDGDFSLKYVETVNGIITTSEPVYSDNVLTYVPTTVKYTALGEELTSSLVTADIDSNGRFYLKNNKTITYCVSEPCLTSTIVTTTPATIITTTSPAIISVIDGDPPEKSSGGGCLLK